MVMSELPLKLLCGGATTCGREWELGGRTFNFPFFRLYFVVGGRAVTTIDGTDCDLKAGNAYLLPGGLPTRNHFDSAHPMRVFWLHGAPMESSLTTSMARLRVACRWPLRDLRLWEGAYTGIDANTFFTKDLRWFFINSLVLALVSDALLKLSLESNEPYDRNYFALKPALELMDREFLSNPPLKRLAAEACQAPNYFHRKFKELFNGITPRQHMERRRLCEARSLLHSSGKSLQEIAEATGYRNAFYFSRAFKKLFGVSPSLLRGGSSIGA